jgi:hypothetical protein
VKNKMPEIDQRVLYKARMQEEIENTHRYAACIAVCKMKIKMGRPEKNDYARVRRRYLAGWSDSKIAKDVKMQPCTVTLWRKRNGLPANHPVRNSNK